MNFDLNDDSEMSNICKNNERKDIDINDKFRKKYITLFICATLTGISGFLLLPFITPALRKICLPFVPATNNQLKRINDMLAKYGLQNKQLIDLGSGDGRVVFSIAQNEKLVFTKLCGIEINRPLVWYSRYLAFKLNIPATFIRKNLWNYKLNSFSNVIIFGVDSMMDELECKLNEELPKEFCVIACRYPLPHWKPVESMEFGHESVWCYVKK